MEPTGGSILTWNPDGLSYIQETSTRISSFIDQYNIPRIRDIDNTMTWDRLSYSDVDIRREIKNISLDLLLGTGFFIFRQIKTKHPLPKPYTFFSEENEQLFRQVIGKP